MDRYSPTFSSAHILATLNLTPATTPAPAGPSSSSPPSDAQRYCPSTQLAGTVPHCNTTHHITPADTAKAFSPAPSSTESNISYSQKSSQVATNARISQTKGKGKEPQKKRGSTDTNALEAGDDDGVGGEDKKRRRRVVVACDTCRRKKVKCKGLPNATSTCENCTAYNYKCTFSADQDRSRGKYEILESKAETLLAALRSVAPRLAEEYDRGQLNITGPSGSSRHPNEDWTALERGASSSSKSVKYHPPHASAPVRPGGAPAGPPLGPSAFEVASILHPLPASARPSLPSIRSLGGPFTTPNRIGPMVPDLEDGRPRFYGKSSTLSHFHALDSRPPSVSPPPQDLRTSGAASAEDESREAVSERDSFGRGVHRQGTMRPPMIGINRAGSMIPSVAERGGSERISGAQPLYPSNSREWVHLLRRKNTVAVGRDDICTDEWLTRYMLPSSDLVCHLLDDIYFPHLHPLLPILHPPTFRRDIKNGRASHDTAFRGLVFCILTISSRFSNDPRVLADPSDPLSAGDQWAAGSRLYHQAFAASLINVQVLLLTATFMHASIGPGSSWTILGVAIRALQDIGLHQERANVDFTPFDQEMRRRTFWSAFILDCIFAVCLGRPNAIQLEDCNVHLPLDVSDEDLLECEISGHPISTTSASDAEVKGEVEGGGEKSASLKYGVATGFRHMVKLNLLVHDVVHILYSHRKTSAQPEWVAHPGVGPVTDTTAGEEHPAEEESVGEKSKDKEKAAKAPSLKKPEYKAMAQLCKRLDEWVAETPEHLQNLATSPFKLQAGIVSCGRHDIRLYILKPFLPDPFLYNMLRPQCTAHARACLTTVLDLYEGGHLGSMVFIFTQAFMSSVTFLLTVWHVTHNIRDVLPDAVLIERTARMMATAFDDRYCSAVFRKAWRVLQRIVTRLLPVLSGDQRKRMEEWAVGDGDDTTKVFQTTKSSNVGGASTAYSFPAVSSPPGSNNTPSLSHLRRGSTQNQPPSGSTGPHQFAATDSQIIDSQNRQVGGVRAVDRSALATGSTTLSRPISRPPSGHPSPPSHSIDHWRPVGGISGAQSPNGNGNAYSPFPQRLMGTSGGGPPYGNAENAWSSSTVGSSGLSSYASPHRDRLSGLSGDAFVPPVGSGATTADANFGDAHGILGNGFDSFGTDDVNLDFFKMFVAGDNGGIDFPSTMFPGQGAEGGMITAGDGLGEGQPCSSDAWQEDFLQFLSGFEPTHNGVTSDLIGKGELAVSGR